VLGAEVCAWGETIDATNFETLVWPRASAFAEAMWYKQTDMEKVWQRLMHHREDLRRDNVNASPLAPQFCVNSDLCTTYSRNRGLTWPAAKFNIPGPLCTGGSASPCDDPNQGPLPNCIQKGVETIIPATDGPDCTSKQGIWDNGTCNKVIQISHDCPANSICVRSNDKNWADKRVCMCPCAGFSTNAGLQQQQATRAYDENNWLLYSNL